MEPTITFFFFFFFFELVHKNTFTTATCNASTLPKFPALLIFGDSTVDTGNNNFIPTLFTSKHSPYGRDLPDHIPTGRFSNGRLVPDLLASALGIKEFIPPFLDPHLSDSELRTGVSFASAGSGYDDLTTEVSKVIPVSKQLQYFNQYLKRLNTAVGEQEAKKIVSGALLLISAGTNDFVYNFYDLPTRRNQFNITGYQDFLLQRVQDTVKELFNHGCRNLMISGLPTIGCIPIQITAKSKNKLARTCVDDENQDARVYDSKLERVVQELQASLAGSWVAYVNIYDPLVDMINHPQKYGFVETNKGCCCTGLVETGPLCNPLKPSCANASQYMFWDSVHGGEAAYKVITDYIMNDIIPKMS